MIVFLVFFAALAPVAWLLWTIYRKDSVQPEPTTWLLKAFLYGVGSVFLTFFISLPLSMVLELNIDKETYDSLFEALEDAFLLAAIPEEAAKLFMLWLLLRKNPFFDEHFDGIVYAVCVGLGFAALENVVYLIIGIGDGSWIGVGVTRALFTVPAHFFCAILMGYNYSIYYFGIDRSVKAKLMVLVSPILAHGIFDALLFCMRVDEALSGVLMILFIIFFTKLRKRATMRIESLSKQNVS